MTEKDWNVLIGEIVASFGLKGEVKVVPHTDFPDHFQVLERVCVGEEGAMRRIERARPHKRLVVIKFAGIDDIDAAEALRGSKIFIRESDLVPLEDGEYYIHDIIGLRVFSTEGEYLGEVKEVLKAPGNDVYVTEQLMIPAAREFILEIDLSDRKMLVRWTGDSNED